MQVADYSALFDLVIDGSVKRYTQIGDQEALREPSRLMMLLREALPLAEKTKLYEAIMATGLTATETASETVQRLTK